MEEDERDIVTKTILDLHDARKVSEIKDGNGRTDPFLKQIDSDVGGINHVVPVRLTIHLGCGH